MADSIGALYNTLMPSLSDTADIQEALRLYHYGAPSGTGPGDYDPTNTNPAILPTSSVAYYLNNLQSQITTISGSLGVQSSVWNAKGVLVTATAASTLQALSVGSDGTVLTADSSTATGLAWSALPVTPTNTVTLSNKTLTAPRFADLGFIADANGNEMIIFDTVTSAVNEVTFANAATTGKPTISATGGDTNITLNLVSKGTGTVQVNNIDIVTTTGTQTLTNKTLTAPTVTQLFLSDSVVVFEGSTPDAFETTLGVIDPTADRTINLPNADGTIALTANKISDFAASTSAELATKISDETGTGTLVFNTTPTLSDPKINILTNTYIGATNTLVLTDSGRLVLVSHTTATTINIPTNAVVAFPIGTQIVIVQSGAGQVTIGGAGVTINGTPGLKLRAQNSGASIIKTAENTWYALGDLAV